MRTKVLLLLSLLSLICHRAFAELPDVLLNQIQVIGTHNSYHIAPAPSVMSALSRRSADMASSLDYTHRPLQEQFSHLGIRQIELDLFADPDGGLYAEPAALKMAPGAPSVSHPEVMRKPGMKIIHVQDIDYLTTTPTLVHALKEVRTWLKANPASCPIMVMLELKHSAIPALTKPIPFGRKELDAVDEEILSVFTPEEIILARRYPRRVRHVARSDSQRGLAETP